MTSIKEDYKDVVLLSSVHVEVKNDIAVSGLVALSIKSANYNKCEKSMNR